MITLKEFMEIADYRITEGGDYYGYGGAYALTSWNGDQNGYSLEIIFDPKTQVVCAVEACDYKHQRAYRLINPVYKDETVDDDAWDDVKWVDLESDDDWLQKALAIKEGKDYDTRVSIPLDIPEDELMILFKAAHERDMSFNEFVEEALKQAIAEYEQDPEGMRARALAWKSRA